MNWLIAILIFTILLIFLFFFPFKVVVFNEGRYLYIKISFLLTLKLNIYALFEKSNINELKKQTKNIHIIKKIKFKDIDIYARGINFNYSINGAYYGLLHAILPILDKYLKNHHINFNYLLDYNGEAYVKFNGLVRARISDVIKGFYGI